MASGRSGIRSLLIGVSAMAALAVSGAAITTVTAVAAPGGGSTPGAGAGSAQAGGTGGVGSPAAEPSSSPASTSGDSSGADASSGTSAEPSDDGASDPSATASSSESSNAPSTSPSATASSSPGDPQDHPMGSQIAKHEGVSSQAMAPRALAVTASVPGLDVSSHDGAVDWASRWSAGKRFVWAKATEGTSYTNPEFASQYNGSANQGFIRGAYHFALPNNSSGSAQAKYFSDNGGGWSGDGKTLPGALDMEYNPYSGGSCYGLSQAQMASWVRDFSSYYLNRWGRYPIIYTSASWWDQCVGTATSISSAQPLWTARYASAVGTLPAGWTRHTVWQYAETPYDLDSFNGTSAELATFARTAGTTPADPCTTTVNGYRVSGAIGCKYATAKSVLGNPVGAMVNRGDGYYQLFANGAITYSGGTGAHEIHGSVFSRWKGLGVDAAFNRLGYATGDGNTDVTFGRGEIVWNAGRARAYIVEGGIWQAYRKIGGSTAMGLPKSDMVAGRGGGVMKMNWFESGAITWGSGIHVVRGAIYTAWTRSGSEAGVYGGPITDTYRSGTAIKQNFYHGYTLSYAGGTVSAARTTG